MSGQIDHPNGNAHNDGDRDFSIETVSDVVCDRHDEILNSSAIGFDLVLLHCECLSIESDGGDCFQLVLMVL